MKAQNFLLIISSFSSMACLIFFAGWASRGHLIDATTAWVLIPVSLGGITAVSLIIGLIVQIDN